MCDTSHSSLVAHEGYEVGHVLDQVDAVVVATPPASHAEVALRGWLARLVDKPLATSVADTQRSGHVSAAPLPCSLHGR
jgi:predicted dehydrogenase